VLPGFHITLGFSILYLSLIVLIPLSALVFKTFTLSWEQFWVAVTAPRVMASYRLTFGASLLAAVVNAVFGLLVAWVLVRYKFPGKRIVDALGRATARAARHQAGLHAGGHRHCADLHRAAVRGAHGAAGA
jgi:sulfate transport system permease protein